MASFIQRAFRTSMDDMSVGLLQSFGADPVKRLADGTIVSSMFGFDVPVKPGIGIAKGAWTGSGGMMAKATGAFVAGSTAYDVYNGYQEKGWAGGARALATNVALNTALVKHGYTLSKVGGELTYNVGRWKTASQLAKMSGAKLALGHAGNIGDFMLRSVWGSVLGEAAGAAMGGGILSTPFAMAGANVGARIGLAGTAGMLGGAAMLGTGYWAAKGATGVLRAGYRHTQMKKLIHTDGDMSSFMTQNAFTMRARAVQAISKSHLNARSALGQEASYLSFPSRNYHSAYKQY